MPLDQPLRAAIIGAGLMGQWHARYASRSGAQIVSVVDPDIERARALAAQFPGATAQAALDHSDAEVAHICAPTDQHFALCRAALEADKHVLVEKPGADSRQQTERLLSLAADHGKRFSVCLQLPFQDGFQELLQQRESLGDAVRIEFRAATAGGEGLDSANRRSVLWEILPHPLSVFAALYGSRAWEADWRLDRFDDQELELSAESDGARWLIFLSLRARPRSLELEWLGSQGRAEVDFYHGYAAFHRGNDTRADKAGRPFREAGVDLRQAGGNLVRRALSGESAYPGLPALISQFYASLTGGPEPISAETMSGIAQVADFVAGS